MSGDFGYCDLRRRQRRRNQPTTRQTAPSSLFRIEQRSCRREKYKCSRNSLVGYVSLRAGEVFRRGESLITLVALMGAPATRWQVGIQPSSDWSAVLALGPCDLK